MRIKTGGNKDFYPTIAGEDMKPELIPEGSCDHLVVNNQMELLQLEEVGGFLKYHASRLKSGGKLYIAGHDCVEISRLFYINEINIQQYNELILRNKVSAWCLVTVKNMLEQIGIVPIVAMLGGIGNCEYYITGVRP